MAESRNVPGAVAVQHDQPAQGPSATGLRRPVPPLTASELPFDHHLLGFRDRLRRAQSLGADIRAVHDGVAAIETEGIFQFVQAKRSEEHTSELQSLMRNSYAVFCFKQNRTNNNNKNEATKKRRIIN